MGLVGLADGIAGRRLIQIIKAGESAYEKAGSIIAGHAF